MRTLSRSTRSRTSCLLTERNAAPISFSRPSNWRAELVEHGGLELVGPGLALLLVGDRHRGGEVALGGGLDGGVDVVLVVEEDREVLDRLGGLLGQLALRLAELLDERLGGVEAAGDDLLGRRLDAALDEGRGLLGGLGLDHHDRDVTGLGDPARDDHVEDGVLELAVGRERHPLCPRSGRRGRRRPGRRTAGRRAGWTATRR